MIIPLNIQGVFMSKKGIKKGHCIRHGLLTDENSVLYKDKDKVRKRCLVCMRNNNANGDMSRKISSFCIEHGIKKTAENNFQCQKCKNAWNRMDRARNPEKYRSWVKKSKDKDRNAVREREVIRVHRITHEIYYGMVEKQKNLCAICKNPEKRMGRNGKDITRLCIDHCHKTGKIRGLLCHACNTAIGKFKDRIDFLEAAIQYLKGDG